MSEKTQREQIAKYLATGRSITALEALDKFKCNRLAARIHELKKMGRDIKKYTARVGPEAKRVACYYLMRGAA
jgi:hypothetical protein